MNYPIRIFSKEDYPALLKFLNANLAFDQLNEALLREKLDGDPFWQPEKALICHDQENMLGFMLGVLRDFGGKRYGFIKLMAVAHNFRRQGIATGLFNKLMDIFEKDHVDVVRIYDVPMNYLMPGIDPRYTEAVCFAMRSGFNRFADTCNLLVDLHSNKWETGKEEQQLVSDGIEISRPSHAEQEEVLKLIQQNWDLWRHEARSAFDDDPPSMHIAKLHGKVKAFSAHNANNKGMAWFGPMGTHPDLRGKGIGSILLKRCLRDMKQAGHEKAIIPWVGPIDFYAHHAGARVDRIFWRYEKIMNSKKT